MVKVVVDVMPKPEILDPQGQAIARALPGLGYPEVRSVRQGKRFELEIDGGDDLDVRRRVAEIADRLLANPVTEDYDVRING